MHYKIVASHPDHADRPTTYTGQFDPKPGEAPALTALATQFGQGNPAAPATARLDGWEDDGLGLGYALEDLEPDATELIFSGNDYEYNVTVSDEPIDSPYDRALAVLREEFGIHPDKELQRIAKRLTD